MVYGRGLLDSCRRADGRLGVAVLVRSVQTSTSSHTRGESWKLMDCIWLELRLLLPLPEILDHVQAAVPEVIRRKPQRTAVRRNA